MGPNDNSVVNVYMVNPSIEQAKVIAKRELGYSGWQNIKEGRTIRVKYRRNNWTVGSSCSLATCGP